MIWQQRLIGEIATLVTKGTTPTTYGMPFTDEGINFVKAEALNGDSSLDHNGFAFIGADTHGKLARSQLCERDVLVTIAGANVGKCGLVRACDLPANTNQAVGIVRIDPKAADPRFVYYYFKLPATRHRCLSIGGQAAQPNVNLANLKSFPINLPDKTIQVEIADVLSAYDDLIENNRRRIALLEQAARELYREWFVRLRFPGHEHVKVVDGVPEGWTPTTLGDVCTPDDGIQTGPFGSQLHQSDYSDEGVPVVMPKDIAEGRISIDAIARIPEEIANKLSRHRMSTGDIVYGRRGEIGRKALISETEAGWFCGTGCLRFRPDVSKVIPHYLFELLGTQAVLGDISNRARGSTMPNLNATVLREVKLLVAKHTLQIEYAKLVEPNLALARNLRAQNRELGRARDLLLPRLMNGNITV